MEQDELYTVYILYSEKFDKTYTGYTSDLEMRLRSHNEFSKKDWTRSYRPWKLIHTETFQSKSEAIKREKFYKSGVGRQLIHEKYLSNP